MPSTCGRQRIDIATDQTRTVLAIAQMDCPTEEGLIRDKLAGMDGVVALDFNLLQRQLTVTHRPGAMDDRTRGPAFHRV